MLRKLCAALAVALTLPLLHGCGDDTANQGQVRLFNTTTAYDPLGLSTQDSSGNTTTVVSGTAKQSLSSYTGIDRGSYTFDLEGGTSVGVAATTTGSISRGNHYTIVAFLTGNALQAQFMSDEEDAPSGGKAKLRIFNAASSEAGGVDVYLTTSPCTAIAVTDAAFATNVTALQSSYTQVTAPAAGQTWNVCVTTTGDKAPTALRFNSTLTLKDQEIATLILTRTSGGVLLNGAVLDQQGAKSDLLSSIARIRLVADAANAASAPAVTATVNGTDLSGTTPSVTDYFVVDTAGTTTATISIDTVPISGVSLAALATGTDYTLLVAGTAGAPSVTLLTDDNTPSTNTSQPVKARLVNGINAIGGTVSASIDGKQVGSAISFAGASQYVTLAASTGTATVTVTGAAIDPLTQQTFASGSVYSLFLLGDSTAPQLVTSQDR